MNRVVFDIETEPFSEQFRKATSTDERIALAPRMRVGCVYFEARRRYQFFDPRKADGLINVLLGAGEIISFNGKNFDLLVLRRHYGLGSRVPRKGKHVDLCEVLSKQVGFNVGLDRLARMNIGEGKHTDGRKMANLNEAELRKACQSDVRQTYRLWKLYERKELQLPKRYEPVESRIDNLGGPGTLMPRTCPNCGSKNVEFVEWDTEQMSDGQAADYGTGFYGEIYCTKCKTYFEFGI